jgi:hypothetical protein
VATERERERFDGDLWALKPGDRITTTEEREYPEEERAYDWVYVLAPTLDGEWIMVRYPIGGGWCEELYPADGIWLVTKGE